MAYSSNAELPDSVKGALPAAGATVVPKNAPRLDVSTDEIVRLYVDERLSMEAVAELVGLALNAVAHRLKKAGVESRSCTAHVENGDTWNYKGGAITPAGYRKISMRPDHPFYEMGQKPRKANSRACFEHRLVMAKHLGRMLEPWEVVHHIDGNGLNNNIENLALFRTQREHLSEHLLLKEVASLRRENKALRRRVEDLESMLEERENGV